MLYPAIMLVEALSAVFLALIRSVSVTVSVDQKQAQRAPCCQQPALLLIMTVVVSKYQSSSAGSVPAADLWHAQHLAVAVIALVLGFEELPALALLARQPAVAAADLEREVLDGLEAVVVDVDVPEQEEEVRRRVGSEGDQAGDWGCEGEGRQTGDDNKEIAQRIVRE